MSEKDEFVKVWEREFPTTLKVLRAYPAAKADFKPHERSRTAKELAWTFVQEEAMIEHVLKGSVDFSVPMPPPPQTFPEVLSAYEKSHREMVGKVKAAPDADLKKTIKFPVAPKQMGDVPRMAVLWMMLMDGIHHRGQFSVYLRMAGGKVPSIYGPSADEPWM